jgi:hypothetical protein
MFVFIASTAFASGRGCGAHINLTEDQIAELHSTKAEMIQAGASGEEIQTAMWELLSSYGFEFSEACGTPKGGGSKGCHGSEGHRGCDNSSCSHAPGECDRSCGKTEGRRGCNSSSFSHAPGECDRSCGKTEGRRGCDNSSCSHAPGECDRSCGKTEDRKACHGTEGKHASGGCCGRTVEDKTSTSAVGENSPNKPTTVAIGEIIPNPFNASVEITIQGKLETSHVLEIFDVQGRMVKNIPISSNSVLWDGKDSQGKELNSGTYFARVAGTSESKKIILMK